MLDQKGTGNIQPIPTIVKWTLKCCFPVEDTLLNCKIKIPIRNINLPKRTDKQQNNTACISNAVTENEQERRRRKGREDVH